MSLSTNSLALDKSQPANHTISEARLLSDAKRGEPEAFEALCQTLRPRLPLPGHAGPSNLAAPFLTRALRAYKWLQIASAIALIVALLVLIFTEMQKGGVR
jgi:hypothetical protein